MSLLLVGVNHRSCPVEVRERLASLGAPAARESLAAEGWTETIVVATCNRFEVYVAGTGPSDGSSLEALAASLDRFAGLPVSRHAYRLSGADAAGHLFEVAAGLDSLVLGEGEILGQVKQAYEAAREAETTAKLTNVLFQRSLFVGKAVRNLTQISMGQLSVAAVAVELAKRIFGGLRESGVMILGAGETAEKTARHLISAKVARLHIANRTWERAQALAASLRADPVRWQTFHRLLGRVDIVVASTGAPEPVLTREMVEAAAAQRRGRSLFIIDIAMPRDVQETVGDLDGVYLYRLEDLQAIGDENAARRQEAISAARGIVRRAALDFGAWMESLRSGPEISLRHHPLRSGSPVPAGSQSISRSSS
ncbi:MAG: glutamyl-tRNA reductase [Elusimicrobiota bacterium]